MRPRTSNEGQQDTAEIRAGEVAICLELLEVQLSQVLGELSWPARRGRQAAERGGDAQPVAVEVEAMPPETSQADDARAAATGPDAVEDGADGARGRYAFGVTLNQIDEVNRLIDTIRAYGDVVTASDHAGFADHTLSILGDAIGCNAVRLRDIILDVNAQRLGPARGTRTGVREELVAYRVMAARLSMGNASRVTRQLPICQ